MRGLEARLIELLFIACAEYETCAFACELARHHEAEPARATGDEYCLVFQIVFEETIEC